MAPLNLAAAWAPASRSRKRLTVCFSLNVARFIVVFQTVGLSLQRPTTDCDHLADFLAAYNFARRLIMLKGFTRYQYI